MIPQQTLLKPAIFAIGLISAFPGLGATTFDCPTLQFTCTTLTDHSQCPSQSKSLCSLNTPVPTDWVFAPPNQKVKNLTNNSNFLEAYNSGCSILPEGSYSAGHGPDSGIAHYAIYAPAATESVCAYTVSNQTHATLALLMHQGANWYVANYQTKPNWKKSESSPGAGYGCNTDCVFTKKQ